MALVSIFERGKISDVDTSLKKYRLLKPRPGVLTSFNNRVGSIVLGVVLALLGLGIGYILFTEHVTTFQTIILILGVCLLPIGLVMIAKASNAYGKEARPHRFFGWDETQVVLGETRPIGQTEIKDILRSPLPQRLAKLVVLGATVVKMPVAAIESIEAHVAMPTLNIDRLKITGAGAEIRVDLDALLPSGNFSGINGNTAFNAISQYYTNATGNTIGASVGKA